MRFDHLVIGASFYGCGLAASLPGRCRVIEASCVPGADFSLTFNGGSDWDAALEHPLARGFLARLQSHRALDSQGRAALAAFSPLLAMWCQEQKLDIELGCSLIAQEGQWVQVMGVDGLKEYWAEQVHDARPKKSAKPVSTALLAGPEGVQQGGYGCLHVQPTIYPGEYYASMTIKTEDKWPDIREQWRQEWLDRPQALEECRLLLIGARLDQRNFVNPAVALDWGLMGHRLEDMP